MSVLIICVCVLFSDEATFQHLSVYLGKTAINDTDADREQKFNVEKLIIHQNFDGLSYNNDIGEYKHHCVYV